MPFPDLVGEECPRRLPKLAKLPDFKNNKLILTNSGRELNGNTCWLGEIDARDPFKLHRVGWFLIIYLYKKEWQWKNWIPVLFMMISTFHGLLVALYVYHIGTIL